MTEENAAAAFVERAAAAGVAIGPAVAADGLVVDLAAYVVVLDGEVLDLSPRQVELLALFLAAPGRVWSRDQLHEVCWGDPAPSRRVDVQLCRLRARTRRDLFRNVRDRGWALRVDAAQMSSDPGMREPADRVTVDPGRAPGESDRHQGRGSFTTA